MLPAKFYQSFLSGQTVRDAGATEGEHEWPTVGLQSPHEADSGAARPKSVGIVTVK